MIRIKGSQRGLAMALDGNGRWCYLDPRLGAMHAVAEAARNVACAGRNSRRRHQLPELRQSRKAAHHVAVFAGDRRHHQSLRRTGNSDHRRQRQLSTTRLWAKESIPRRCWASSAFWKMCTRRCGRISASRDAPSSLLRGAEPGDATDAEADFGSSEYAKEILGAVWGYPPAIGAGKRGRSAEGAGGDCPNRN